MAVPYVVATDFGRYVKEQGLVYVVHVEFYTYAILRVSPILPQRKPYGRVPLVSDLP